MFDRFQTDAFHPRTPNLPEQCPPLPPWLARRLLGADETISWVWGPKFSPNWERYATHPVLFLIALATGALFLWIGSLLGGDMLVVAVLLAGGIVLTSVFVLGISSAYFTRLLVTNSRLLILQGYEVCSKWGIDELPRSLVHYGMAGSGLESRTVDLNSLKNLLAGASDKFAESKTIMAFGKRLQGIKSDEERRT
jgi:hypothetical protein